MGPNWNDGKRQRSQKTHSARPVDYGDSRAMVHDDAYANTDDNMELRAADFRFAREVIGRGKNWKERGINTLAGVGVGLQGVGRSFYYSNPNHSEDL